MQSLLLLVHEALDGMSTCSILGETSEDVKFREAEELRQKE